MDDRCVHRDGQGKIKMRRRRRGPLLQLTPTVVGDVPVKVDGKADARVTHRATDKRGRDAALLLRLIRCGELRLATT